MNREETINYPAIMVVATWQKTMYIGIKDEGGWCTLEIVKDSVLTIKC